MPDFLISTGVPLASKAPVKPKTSHKNRIGLPEETEEKNSINFYVNDESGFYKEILVLGKLISWLI